MAALNYAATYSISLCIHMQPVSLAATQYQPMPAQQHTLARPVRPAATQHFKPPHAQQRTLAKSSGADDDSGCGSVALLAASAAPPPPPRVCRNEVGRAPLAAIALPYAACGAAAGADAGAAAGTPAIACRAAQGVFSNHTGLNAAARAGQHGSCCQA